MFDAKILKSIENVISNNDFFGNPPAFLIIINLLIRIYASSIYNLRFDDYVFSSKKAIYKGRIVIWPFCPILTSPSLIA